MDAAPAEVLRTDRIHGKNLKFESFQQFLVLLGRAFVQFPVMEL